jgi:hypothetical protein
VSSDELYASPKAKTYTLDGSTDVNIQTDGDSPCRAVVLLGTGAGNLVVTSASLLEGQTSDTIPIDNLPAGYRFDEQWTKIAGSGSVGGDLKIRVLW